jgi:LmbE family N-acetylglucosaminyl deacetylase
VLTAASPVPPFNPGLTATVVAQAGMTYSWSIVGGTLTSPADGVTAGGLNTVTYTSGAPGTLTLSAAEQNALGDASAPGTAVVTVSLPLTPPLAPSITAPTSILTGASGTASVVARPYMLYDWAITGGTITSPGGASGVLAGGLSTITFSAGAPGTLTLSCVETTGLGTSSPGVATVTVTAPPPATGHMYFVAHQDDDLLFMNPDITRSVTSGVPTQTVFLTAGDDGSCTACWQGRENGIWNAYSAMANVTKDWTCTPTAYGGKTVSQCVLNTAPHVSVVFLRLPDGGLSSLWATEVGPPFYVAPVNDLTSVDGAYAVTRAEAITLVHDLIVAFHPARVGALDGTLAYGDDHPDHIVTGLFTLEAALRAPSPLPLHFYRAYNIYGTWFSIPSPEPENLSLAEYAEKVRVMEAYGGAFPVDGDFDRWCHRQYSVSRALAGNGPLVEPGGKCLDTQSGATASGSPIEVRPCDGGATQEWTLASDGSILGAAGRCLALDTAGAVVLADCDGSLSQRFALFSNGQLRAPGGGCLTVGWDGTSVSTALCDPDRSTDKYLPLPAQRFTQVFGPLELWSQGTDFSDADVGGAASYYGTLALGRSDAGGLLDACVRRASGVACASNTNADFGPLEGVAGPFDDGTGWFPVEYGATVQLADVDGDGLSDACGRSAAGIACALRGPTGGFGAVLPWTSDFGDATFGGAAYSPSVRFGDLDGDGFADVCGRAADGLQCAKNTHVGSFAPATPWLPGEFTDAGGWDAAASTGTLQLGDLTGDGRADVCLRGAAGLRCAVSSGEAFVDPHLWSFRAEWSDAEGWSLDAGRHGSIRLGDVNGDGKADVCGRAATGLVCALSTGSAFEGAAPQLTQGFTDALGWAPEAYGSTLRLGDLNGDTRADVCGRASDGLVCALAP